MIVCEFEQIYELNFNETYTSVIKSLLYKLFFALTVLIS